MDWHSSRIQSLLEHALAEDHALADATTLLTVTAEAEAQAEIIAKQDCTVAGLGLVPEVFAAFAAMQARAGAAGPQRAVVVSHHPEVFDGVRVQAGQTLAVVRGPARPLLSCERVTLNLLQRMSGIATLTRQFVDAVAGLPVRLLDTRKTAPGLRLLDKYAVTCGGGRNHRADLSDAILIKNNHIRMAGGIAAVLERARKHRRAGQVLEIEVRTPEELQQALANGAERLLVDNMTPEQVAAAVREVGGRVPVEVSGGVRLGSVRAYAETGADFISVGALTHSAPAADISMRIVPV
ncbi:MAG: carboxylating nicotinate-nucleotide diphosphorylase [Terriglobales bacterium]